MLKLATILILLNSGQVFCFWDLGTTTVRGKNDDDSPRTSFFRWMWVYTRNLKFWFYNWNWDEIERRRRLCVIAGISIDMIPLSTATILNRRALITSYNFLDPYMNRQKEMRIWALGRAGLFNTPYRYRVWSVTRLVPLSTNPEHCHGPRCIHQPRHDVSVIISRDMMYLYDREPTRYHYAYRAFMPWPIKFTLQGYIWMAGSGYEYMQHIIENYKIFYYQFNKKNIVDCSTYLPKWWGKFICIKNMKALAGVQNGGGLFCDYYIVGLGAFEIRYNEDRILVFTDLRYYRTKISHYASLQPGQYYEYAYPQWGVKMSWLYEGHAVYHYIPGLQIQYDLYPLG